MRPMIIFFFAALFLYVPLAFIDYAHFPFSDGAEHGAVVKELARNMSRPREPMLAAHSGKSSRFVPSALAMAALMRLLGLDIITTLKISLIFFFYFFVTAAALFGREYFQDSRQLAWTPMTLLFLWGSGWTGANAYMFSAILYTAYFPSVVAFSLALFGLYFQMRAIRSGHSRYVLGQIFCGALSFVNHPLTGGFFFLASALLLLENGAYRNPRLAAQFIFTAVAACLVVQLWPYYNFFSSLTKIASGQMGQTQDYQLTRQYLYSSLAFKSGPALVAVPLLFWFWAQKRHLFITCGALFCSLIYIGGFFLKISLAERFIFFIIFFLQLGLAKLCANRLHIFKNPPTGSRRSKLSSLLLLPLLCGCAIQAGLVYNKFITPAFVIKQAFPFITYHNPNAHLIRLGRYLKEGDVVISDIYSAWSVPVYSPAKIVALYHTPPHVDDNIERVQDMNIFYDANTAPAVRKTILHKYNATHVLIDKRIWSTADIISELEQMGLRIVVNDKEFCLLSTDSTA